MSEQPKKFYLTTPIYYVNARPHIGHAYTTIVADVLARRHRLLGDDTFFLTGTDEHGQKIERSAAAAGVPPRQFADQVSAQFRALWDRMGLIYNEYIRTTDPKHARGVQKLFTELYNRGHIYLSTYTGSYCVSDEAFVDAPIGTPCPDCGRLLEEVTEENFFFRLSAFQRPLLDLIESDTLKITPESSKNEVLSFLRGNVAAQSQSTNSVSSRPESSQPHREDVVERPAGGTTAALNEAPDGATNRSQAHPQDEAAGLNQLNTTPQISRTLAPATGVSSGAQEGAAGFSPLNADTPQTGASAPALAHSAQGTPYVPGALKDLSISRSSFTWGIPVPEDVQQAAGTQQKHVIYVWLDALANYMTAVGYGSDDPEDQADFARYWPADLHLVGKEITRFHCVYWPAFLLALNPASSTDLSSRPESSQPHREDVVERPAGVPPQLSPEAHQAWAAKWLPKQITANGWLLFDNAKMSKSRGNVVRTETILEAFGSLCPPIKETGFNSPRLSTKEPGSNSPWPPMEETGFNSPPLKGTGFSPSENTTPENAALAAEGRPPTAHERDLFASDVLRYFLLREIPFGQDGSFSFDAMVTRYNADLANGYGNLVSRTLTMIHQYFDDEYQSFKTDFYFDFVAYAGTPNHNWIGFGEVSALQRDPTAQKRADDQEPGDSLAQAVETYVYDLQFTQATDVLMQAITVVDGYLTRHAPWKLAKQVGSRNQLEEILMNAAEAVRYITACMHDILPFATARVWAQLGLGDIEEAARKGELKNLQWGGLKPGTKLGPLAPIFPRADKGLTQIMIDMENENASRPAEPLKSAATPAPPAPVAADPTHPAAPPRSGSLDEPSGTLPVAGSAAVSTERTGTPSHTQASASGIFGGEATKMPTEATPQITIDDFAKIELRVAQIIVAERIPKADKLLRLEVDLGYEKRQILSGIAEWYTPEDLLGRRIVVITNLAPRKMRGLESHGMLLAASDGEGGKPVLATFGEDIALGSRLK